MKAKASNLLVVASSSSFKRVGKNNHSNEGVALILTNVKIDLKTIRVWVTRSTTFSFKWNGNQLIRNTTNSVMEKKTERRQGE